MNRPSPADTRFDGLLVQWLEDGPTTGPEDVLLTTFARTRSTGQDRTWNGRSLSPAGLRRLSTAVGFALLTVLVALVVLGLPLLQTGRQGPGPSRSPTPVPGTFRLGSALQGGADYTVAPFQGSDWAPCGPTEDPCAEAAVDDDIRFTFTVPDGWAGAGLGPDIWLADGANSGPDGAGLLLGRGGWLYRDPCGTADPEIPVGPTVDDFVQAIVDHPLADATQPVDAVIDGFQGKYLEIQGPADLIGCQEFQVWANTFYAQGADNHWLVWVIDFEGVRLVIHGSEFPETAPERSAELRAIVQSLRIDRDPAVVVASPRPSASSTTAP